MGAELINADRRTDLTEIQTNMTNPVGALRDLAISRTSGVRTRTLYNFSENFLKNVQFIFMTYYCDLCTKIARRLHLTLHLKGVTNEAFKVVMRNS